MIYQPTPLFQMIGTSLAFINTVALFIILCQTSEKAIYRGAEVALILNIFITVYFIFEQVHQIFLLF